MQKVNSFIIDHKKLVPGIYECAVNGIFTYDRSPKFDEEKLRAVFTKVPVWAQPISE